MTTENLDDLAEEITEFADDLGLVVFPGMPVGNGMTAVAQTRDWRNLLLLASAGTLLYLQARILTDDDIATFRQDLADEDGHLDAESADRLARLRSGSTAAVEIAWAGNGVLNLWVTRTAEVEAIEDELEIARFRRDVEWQQERARSDESRSRLISDIEKIAGQLAEHSPFIAGRRKQDRRRVAELQDLEPELAAALSAGRDSELYSPALRILERAETLRQNEVLPRIEAQIREDLDELAASLAKSDDFRTVRNKETHRRLARSWLMEQRSHATPDLTELLLERARDRVERDSG